MCVCVCHSCALCARVLGVDVSLRFGQSGAKSDREGLEFEASKFVELAQTDVSTALIGLFDGMNGLKKNR